MAFLDNVFGSSDNDAQKYLQQALASYNNLKTPTMEESRVGELPMQTVQGTVSPEDIAVADQGPSEYNNISLDPASRAAQMQALQQYIDIANAGGLDSESKLALQQIIDQTNNQSRGAQGAIMDSAKAMGQGGGDFALTQRAIASQGASNNAATQGMQAAAIAEANKRAALDAMANIGGSVNAADWGQAAEKARAGDTINATNTGARNAANTQDVANKIQTGEFNVGTAQGVNAANTTAGQNKVYYNASLPQQRFNNELAKASGIAGVNGTQANAAQNAANANLAFTGSLLGTAGTVAGAALGGPAGAAVGSQAGKLMPQKKASASPDYMNAAHGGVAKKAATCYAEGGVAHDHGLCEKFSTMDMTGGGHVVARGPEEAAEVPGDSEKNDKIPAALSEGELVIPRTVPKTGEAMEQFARNAPMGGNTEQRVDLTSFTKNYKRGR